MVIVIGTISVVVVGVVVAWLVAAAVRYAAYRGCGSDLAGAEEALESMRDASRRADLETHLAYLKARLAKGRLQAKRDASLGKLRSETRDLLAAALGPVEAPHLAVGHHVE